MESVIASTHSWPRLKKGVGGQRHTREETPVPIEQGPRLDEKDYGPCLFRTTVVQSVIVLTELPTSALDGQYMATLIDVFCNFSQK